VVKARKITVFEVKCPKCGKIIKTEKEENIQCRNCGERFDLD